MDVMTQKHIYEVFIAILTLIIFNGLCVAARKKLAYKIVVKVSLIITLVMGNVVIVLILLFYFLTDSILYYPHFDKDIYLQLSKNYCMEELETDTPVGTCNGWFYHSPQESELTIILYPGNMQTAGEMMSLSGAFENQSEALGLNLIVMDYPGYGRSDGIPAETTMKSMALSAFDGIMNRSDMQDQKVVLMGYSLGTGIANYVASERDVDGLILIAPYQNGYDLFNGFVDIFHGPMKLFIPYRMRADKFAATVDVKPLIIASKDDPMVPYESSLELSDKYSLGSEMKTYDGLGHGGFWQDDQVWKDIREYLIEIV